MSWFRTTLQVRGVTESTATEAEDNHRNQRKQHHHHRLRTFGLTPFFATFPPRKGKNTPLGVVLLVGAVAGAVAGDAALIVVQEIFKTYCSKLEKVDPAIATPYSWFATSAFRPAIWLASETIGNDCSP